MPNSIRADIYLMETMQYGLLLTEAGRVDFLAKTYGEKLEAKYIAGEASETEQVRNPVNAEPGQTLGVKVLSFLLSYDPTRNQSYTQWIVMRYLQDKLRLEDLPRVHESLELFSQAKGRLPVEQRDINKFQSEQELYDVLAPFREGQ